MHADAVWLVHSMAICATCVDGIPSDLRLTRSIMSGLIMTEYTANIRGIDFFICPGITGGIYPAVNVLFWSKPQHHISLGMQDGLVHEDWPKKPMWIQ